MALKESRKGGIQHTPSVLESLAMRLVPKDKALSPILTRVIICARQTARVVVNLIKDLRRPGIETLQYCKRT